MKNNYYLVEYYRAEKTLRFVNFIIDYVFGFLVVMIFMAINVFLYSFSSGTSVVVNAEKLENINPLLDRFLTALGYIVFMYLIEYLSKGRSLGKLITGTVVVKEDGSAPISTDFLKRNFSRLVPFDLLSFLGYNGWHDSWSNTRVVKKRAFQDALEREISIDDIGKE